MKLKLMAAALATLALTACAGPNNGAANVPSYELGNGLAVQLQDGAEYSIAYGGLVERKLTTKAALTTAPYTSPSYNVGGFAVILKPKVSGTYFAVGQKVWIFSKGSSGYLLNATGDLASPPEPTVAANYTAVRASSTQLALTIPANLPAGVYSVVVAASGDSEATAKAKAVSSTAITVTEAQFGTASTWSNPVASASPALVVPAP